jgi:hypothetical protein
MAGLMGVLGNLNKWAASKKMALEALGKTVGANMEAHAKTYAPWQPVNPKPWKYSGKARRELTGGFFWDGPNGISYIAHTVEYGKWLEIAGGEVHMTGDQMEVIKEGKYAILKPTRDKFAERAFKAAERIMK